MSLLIQTFVLGPLENNTYLLVDDERAEAAVIDPSFDCSPVLEAVRAQNLRLTKILLTHSHFDHIAGVAQLSEAFPGVAVGLHPGDLDLWRQGGASALIGLQLKLEGEPTLSFYHGQQLAVGGHRLEVRQAPGQTPGHVLFYAPSAAAAFCGDVIFFGSIGRTDLPGGSQEQLLHSIRAQVLTLPDETVLYPGHGEPTTVAHERHNNPFL